MGDAKHDTEGAIALAMLRLLSRHLASEDVRLTVTELSKESGVSRATLYRHREMLDYWSAIVARVGETNLTLVSEIEERALRERNARLAAERTAEGLASGFVELLRRCECSATDATAGSLSIMEQR